MRRETKVNLWFLIVFLVVSLPGAVILFRKKLDPSAARMDQPDQVVRALPYMTPPPWPPGMRWIVPPKTREWVNSLAAKRTGSPTFGDEPSTDRPDISSDHMLQFLGVRSGAGKLSYELLLWGSYPTDNAAYDIRLDGGPLVVEQVEHVEIPEEVRHELVSLDFSHPPTEVTLIEVKASHILVLPDQSLTLDCRTSSQPLHTSVTVSLGPPQNPSSRPADSSHDPR